MIDESLKLENQVCFPLYAASRLITKLYQPILSRWDLTYPQYLVLLVLWEKDKRNVSDICKCLALETSTLTPLLKRLEGKGYIHRSRSATDERNVLIELTEKGKQAQKKAKKIPAEIISNLKAPPITEADIIHLKTTLAAIINIHS